MADRRDWNARIIDEFRANAGVVGGPFDGVPLVLVHHVGRRTGTPRVAPLAYLPSDSGDAIYIFASKGGAPTNPDWYGNLVAAGAAVVERGTQSYPVTVVEVTGQGRDAVFAEQVRRVPTFGEYAEKTAGVRVIPVLRLDPVD
ncbi:MAG: nitroreductase family deazaflavin-dependent oxidoreductase [Candidatus Lutibacillus vidarii]|nr:nitroreductase family deazaflavin-dependent oxidoreductase [Candidatus Lutibacillus vidarii]